MSQWRRPARLLASLFLLVVASGSEIVAQSTANKAVSASPAVETRPGDDPEFARLVKEWTTKPEFSSPLVDHLPKVAGVPSPKDVLGHHIGEPKKLTYYADILKYYRALAAATPRVKVVTIGKSTEGRDLVVVFVGADESISNLETYRGYLAQLADPRAITDAQAKDIIAKAKPLYHLSGGLHSGEVGPSEMLMELTYRLATEDSTLVKQIRDHVIVSLTPVADPDGRDRNVDWYLQWHPPIMHDLHQAQTLLYTFSGQAPQNPNLDPILFGELPMMANFEMAQMAKYGMPGVWTHGYVDMWSPGYLAFMSSNHNGMIRMYEIQGTSGANTTKLRLGNPNVPAAGGRGGRGGGDRGTQQSESARLVPALAGHRRIRLVAAQQHELRRDRRADGAAVHGGVPQRDPRELLPEIAQLGGYRPQGNGRGLRDSRRAARLDARRGAGQHAPHAGH